MAARIGALLIFCAASTAQAGERCVAVPEGSPDPVVKVCETKTQYTMRVAGTDYAYEKEEYRAALRAELRGVLEDEGVAVDDGEIELWVAVPEASPAATQARAVVRTELGTMVAFLSLHPAEWALDRKSIAVLVGPSEYPDSYGVRAGELLVKGAEGATEAAIQSHMVKHGALPVPSEAAVWHTVRTPLFAESDVRASALEGPDAKSVVQSIMYNDIVEWIARRERAFGFPLGAP